MYDFHHSCICLASGDDFHHSCICLASGDDFHHSCICLASGDKVTTIRFVVGLPSCPSFQLMYSVSPVFLVTYRISPNKPARARCKTQWGGVYFNPKTSKHYNEKTPFFSSKYVDFCIVYCFFKARFYCPVLSVFDTLFVYIAYFQCNVVSNRWRI